MPFTSGAVTAVFALFGVMPSSGNYELNNYSYGSGGTGESTSTNFSLNATTGETSNVQSESTNFRVRSGNNNVQQANVPVAPSFTNPANYYDKLNFIINPSDNPSDARYSIAISDDNFVTVRFIQNDNTIGANRGPEDYQTYAAWGGVSGQQVVGLKPATTYKIRVNAIHGSFSETEYGPEASAMTAAPTLSFDIDTSATDTETAPPYGAAFGPVLPATVINSAETIWIDLDTNANSGAAVYLRSANSGLTSSAASHTIASASADLGAVGSGYGAIGSTATQLSGGPIGIVAPYNGTLEEVGLLDGSLRSIFSSISPVVGGRASFLLKVKTLPQTPASDDYEDTLTIIAAASF